MLYDSEGSTEKRPLRLFFKHIIRKVFLEDWVMKLIALVITFALWLGVTGLSTPTTTRFSGVPLNLRVSNNMEITNKPIQEVDIVISGDRRRIGQINKSDLILSLDLTDVTPGDRVIQLTPENAAISLPPGIKLEEIQPSRIAVRFEAVEEKEIEVRAETEGELPEGLEIYSEIVTPPRVRVRGPASFIKPLNFVSTEKIDLTGRSEDFTAKQVPIVVSNSKATVLDTVVDVTFRIGEKRIEKTFTVPVADSPEKRATFTLFGPRSLLENLRPDSFKVETNDSSGGQNTPSLVLPPALLGNVEIRKLKIN